MLALEGSGALLKFTLTGDEHVGGWRSLGDSGMGTVGRDLFAETFWTLWAMAAAYESD